MAAVLDETQGNIVRRAVALLESRLRGGSVERKVPRRVAEELEKASTAIRKRDAKWAMVSDLVEQATTPIEDLSPAMWGREV